MDEQSFFNKLEDFRKEEQRIRHDFNKGWTARFGELQQDIGSLKELVKNAELVGQMTLMMEKIDNMWANNDKDHKAFQSWMNDQKKEWSDKREPRIALLEKWRIATMAYVIGGGGVIGFLLYLLFNFKK